MFIALYQCQFSSDASDEHACFAIISCLESVDGMLVPFPCMSPLCCCVAVGIGVDNIDSIGVDSRGVGNIGVDSIGVGVGSIGVDSTGVGVGSSGVDSIGVGSIGVGSIGVDSDGNCDGNGAGSNGLYDSLITGLGLACI